MTKIYGIKKVAGEMKRIPYGFHLEIWACKKGKDYEVWTSDLLSFGWWTAYKDNPEYVRIDGFIDRYQYETNWMEGRTPSITESIRAVIEDAFSTE